MKKLYVVRSGYNGSVYFVTSCETHSEALERVGKDYPHTHLSGISVDPVTIHYKEGWGSLPQPYLYEAVYKFSKLSQNPQWLVGDNFTWALEEASRLALQNKDELASVMELGIYRECGINDQSGSGVEE
jgi:hypothetical protein